MMAFPLAAFYVTETEYFVLDGFGLHDVNGETISLSANYGLPVLVAISAALLVFAMLSYKDRSKQLKMIRLAYLIMAALLVGIFFLIRMNADAAGLETYELKYGIAYFLPIVAILLSFLASRSIKKDEELVRSLDRLR